MLIFVVNLNPKKVFSCDGSAHNGSLNHNYFEQKLNFAGRCFEKQMK